MTVELDRVALRHVLGLLDPLAALGEAGGLESLLDAAGWEADNLGISASGLAAYGAALETALGAATEVVEQEEIDLLAVAESLVSLGGASAQLASGLTSLPTAGGVPADALGKLRDDLLMLLVEHYAASRFPRAALLASLLGVLKPVQEGQVVRADGKELRRQSTRLRVDTAPLAAALRDPLAHLRTNFLLTPQAAPRAAQAVADLVGPVLADGLVATGITAGYGIVPVEPGLSLTTAEEGVAEHLLLVDALVPGASAGATAVFRVALGLTDDTNLEGLGVLVAASGDVSISRALANGTLTLRFKGAKQPLVITSKSVRVASGATTSVMFDAGAKYATSGSQPGARFGSAKGTRLEIDRVQVAVGVVVAGSTVEVAGGVDLTGVLLAIRGGDGDGFLSHVLPKDPIELRGDLGLDASLRKGVVLRGSGGLDWRVGLGKSIGPLEIREVRAALRLADAVALEFGSTLALRLGPILASVDGLGVSAQLRTPPGGGAGNSGPFDLAVSFQPPRGLGIGVDAGPVVGGGFISFDPEKGRYAGLLQLGVGPIQVKAIGLLDTKLPGGQQGYSFLIIVTAEFPPIQLGFGFTLNGVGGLAGIQRTMVVEAIQSGIRSGSVDHILFPEDPIRDAPQIVSDLQAIFPPQQGRYVFGPMAIIGYGTPALVVAELGILLEVPAPVRLVLLGQISAILPPKTKEAGAAVKKQPPGLELHLDVLGIVDFGKKTVSLDAVLHDSKLAEFPLFGDMALRASFGEEPAFAFAIGGFNPRFTPPPAFPALRRLTLVVSQNGNPQAVLQCYLALTSNSLQLGARGDLTATKLGFSFAGWLGFDVLVVISPLSFIADLTAAVEVRKGSVKIASVALEATLTGPNPWHLQGRASFDFIVRITVPIELTVGEGVTAEIPPADPWSLLQPALEDARNWSALPSPSAFRVCSLREPPGLTGPLVDPLGGVQVHQRVCPLNRRLARFGEVPPKDHERFDLRSVSPDTSPPSYRLVQDYFALGQFEALSDADRLSRPGFEKMDAGIALMSDAIAVGAAIGDTVSFDTTIVDAPDGVAIGDPAYSPFRDKSGGYKLPVERQTATLAGSAGGRSPLSTSGEQRYLPAADGKVPAALADEAFLIVDRDSLKRSSDFPKAIVGKGAAFEALDEYLREHPEARGRLQVVPEHEVLVT